MNSPRSPHEHDNLSRLSAEFAELSTTPADNYEYYAQDVAEAATIHADTDNSEAAYKRPTTHSRYEGVSNRDEMTDLRTQFYDQYSDRLEALKTLSTADMVAQRSEYYREFIKDSYLDEYETPEQQAIVDREKALAHELISMSDKTFNSVLDQLYGEKPVARRVNVRRMSSADHLFNQADDSESADDALPKKANKKKAANNSVSTIDELLDRIDNMNTNEKKRKKKSGKKSENRVNSIDDLLVQIDNMEDNSPSVTDTPSNHETAEEQATVSYQDAAMAFSARMKSRTFGRKKQELQKAYDTQEALLEQSLEAASSAKLASLEAEGLSDSQIAEKMAEFVNEQNREVSSAQHDAMLGKYEKNTGRLARIRKLGRRAMDAYANTSKGKKIAVGVGIGAVTVGVSAAAVAAGGAMAVVGGAGVIGARIGRAYSLSRAKLYERPNVPHVYALDKNGEYKTAQQIVEESAATRREASRERINDGDKKKKIALGVTAVSAVIGGAGVAHMATEHFDTVRGWFGGDSVEAKAPEVPPVIEKEVPPKPNISLDDILKPTFDASEYVDAQTITSGEGWFQTFGELGIANAHDQVQLLNNDVLMAKLANMGVAYPDASIGGWGMNMTADGKLPTEALKLIHDTAQQSGMAGVR